MGNSCGCNCAKTGVNAGEATIIPRMVDQGEADEELEVPSPFDPAAVQATPRQRMGQDSEVSEEQQSPSPSQSAAMRVATGEALALCGGELPEARRESQEAERQKVQTEEPWQEAQARAVIKPSPLANVAQVDEAWREALAKAVCQEVAAAQAEKDAYMLQLVRAHACELSQKVQEHAEAMAERDATISGLQRDLQQAQAVGERLTLEIQEAQAAELRRQQEHAEATRAWQLELANTQVPVRESEEALQRKWELRAEAAAANEAPSGHAASAAAVVDDAPAAAAPPDPAGPTTPEAPSSHPAPAAATIDDSPAVAAVPAPASPASSEAPSSHPASAAAAIDDAPAAAAAPTPAKPASPQALSGHTVSAAAAIADAQAVVAPLATASPTNPEAVVELSPLVTAAQVDAAWREALAKAEEQFGQVCQEMAATQAEKDAYTLQLVQAGSCELSQKELRHAEVTAERDIIISGLWQDLQQAEAAAELPLPPAIALHEGVAVEAPLLGVYYHGTVSRVHANGFIDVDLNINQQVQHLLPHEVRVNEAFERRQAEIAEAWLEYQALRTDVERIHFCEELKGMDVPPEDWEQATGRLALLIRMGAIRALRGSWLITRQEQGLPIDRRQDMPHDAYWDPEELLRSWARSKGSDQQCASDGLVLGPLSLVLVAVSLCWCSQGHPDPDCYHLRRIAMLLQAFAKFRQQNGSPWKDVAVFWDFPSLFQSPRTPLEDALFGLASGSMQLVYGHDLAMIWKLIAMPPCPQSLDARRCFEAEVHGERRSLAWFYGDRGWPSFESATADARLTVVGSRMAFEDEELAPLEDYPETFRFRSTGMALHPDRLARALATKTFTNSSDCDLVTKLYQETFNAVKRARKQNFQRIAWTEDRMTQYFETLAEMPDLKEFILAYSALGDRCVERFAEQLREKQQLQTLTLINVGLTDAGMGLLLANLPAGLRDCTLDNHQITLEDIREGIQMPRALEMLSIEENCIGDRGAARLPGLLPATLRRLFLASNAIGDTGAAVLLANLPVGLQSLDLRNNHIALEDMRGPVQLPVGLVQVDLGGNRVGDRGAGWLAEGLPVSFARLLLQNNLIGNAGAEAMAGPLSMLPALECVVLTGNTAITEAGQRAFTAVLPQGSVDL